MERVRDEQKFESVEALKEQLQKDEKFVRTSAEFSA
jgi:FAD synthase